MFSTAQNYGTVTVIICLSELSPFSCWRQGIVMFLWFYLNILRQQWRPFWATVGTWDSSRNVYLISCCSNLNYTIMSHTINHQNVTHLTYIIQTLSLHFYIIFHKKAARCLCFKINSLCQVWHLRNLYSSTTAIKVDNTLSPPNILNRRMINFTYIF